jgi:hypothetical protein
MSNWGTRNHKTIVRIDTYITDVHKGKVHSETDYDVIVDGEFQKMKGVYYLCDGGYQCIRGIKDGHALPLFS